MHTITLTGGPSCGPYRAAVWSPQDKNSVFNLLNLRFIYKCRSILMERSGLVGLSRSVSAYTTPTEDQSCGLLRLKKVTTNLLLARTAVHSKIIFLLDETHRMVDLRFINNLKTKNIFLRLVHLNFISHQSFIVISVHPFSFTDLFKWVVSFFSVVALLICTN
jgi:hypothetical protein